MQAYPHLTAPLKIRNTIFRNRFFVAPHGMHTIQMDEEYPTDALLQYYIEKAKGGAACVTLSGFNKNAPDPNDQLHIRLCWRGLKNGLTQRAYRKFVDAMHFYGAVASVQMGFQGVKNRDGFMTGPSDLDTIGFGGQHIIQKEATLEDIENSIEEVSEIALSFQKAGFDMISFMGGHGTSMAQWVNPKYNHRTDEYGGSLENRARLPIRMFQRIREKCGPDFLIEYRMSGYEFEPDAPSVAETVDYVKRIEDYIDILHVSVGTNLNPATRCIIHPTGFLPDAPNAYLAKAMKDGGVKVPVLAIGAIFDPADAERLLAEDWCDLVASARAWIADPQLMQKVLRGNTEEIRPCIKCMRCLDGYKDSNFFSCSVNPAAGRELDLMHWRQPVESQKKCAVIGGGPAGLVAALTLADRGHQVSLFEKTNRLGGQLNLAGIPTFKRDIRKYRDYLIERCHKQPAISIYLNRTISQGDLQDDAFDAIFLAIGGYPNRPAISGIELPHVLSAWDALEKPPKGRVVILGGGDVGCETALHLLDSGADSATVVEIQATIAPKAIFTYRMAMLQRMEGRVTTLTETRVLQILKDGVRIADRNGAESTLTADAVVYAVGTQAMIPSGLSDWQGAVLLGDCRKTGNLYTATRTAYEAALQIR